MWMNYINLLHLWWVNSEDIRNTNVYLENASFFVEYFGIYYFMWYSLQSFPIKSLNVIICVLQLRILLRLSQAEKCQRLNLNLGFRTLNLPHSLLLLHEIYKTWVNEKIASATVEKQHIPCFRIIEFSKDLIFKEQFQVYNKIERKLQKFPMWPLPPCHLHSLTLTTSLIRTAHCTKMNLHWHVIFTQSP